MGVDTVETRHATRQNWGYRGSESLVGKNQSEQQLIHSSHKEQCVCRSILQIQLLALWASKGLDWYMTPGMISWSPWGVTLVKPQRVRVLVMGPGPWNWTPDPLREMSSHNQSTLSVCASTPLHFYTTRANNLSLKVSRDCLFAWPVSLGYCLHWLGISYQFSCFFHSA